MICWLGWTPQETRIEPTSTIQAAKPADPMEIHTISIGTLANLTGIFASQPSQQIQWKSMKNPIGILALPTGILAIPIGILAIPLGILARQPG